MNILGVGLQHLNNEKCQGEVAVEFIREETAKNVEDAIKPQMPAIGTALSLYLHGLRIQVDGATAGPGGGLAGGIGPGGRCRAGCPPSQIRAGSQRERDSKVLPQARRKGRTLELNMDLSLNERAYDRIYGLSQGIVMRAKGMVDMAGGEPRYYELAAAGMKYRDDVLKKGEKDVKPAKSYPRGTFPRDDSQGRLSRIWPPNQRVSWMAGLLPFLGYQEVYDNIQPTSRGGRRSTSNRGPY